MQLVFKLVTEWVACLFLKEGETYRQRTRQRNTNTKPSGASADKQLENATRVAQRTRQRLSRLLPVPSPFSHLSLNRTHAHHTHPHRKTQRLHQSSTCRRPHTSWPAPLVASIASPYATGSDRHVVCTARLSRSRPYAHAGQTPEKPTARPLATPGLCGCSPPVLLRGQPSHGDQRVAATTSSSPVIVRRLWHASPPALAQHRWRRRRRRRQHGQPLLGVPPRRPGRGQS